MTVARAQNWKTVQAEVLRRIQQRIWPPGALIPSEADLAAEFGCARATVSRAMREVADQGLIVRKRKAGTRVATHPERRATVSIPLVRIEVERRGAVWRYRLVDRSVATAPAVIAARLGVPGKADLLHLRSLHLADTRPYLAEDRWINPAAVPAALDTDFSTENANEWLVQNAPFTHGQITMSAAAASQTEADLLGTDPGTALFILERTTWNGDQPVTTVRMAYSPDYHLTMAI